MKKFFKIYFPFLITFLNKRLVTQTDIIFAAMFGSSAIAAAGIPNSLMIIDQITAMSIAPILSMKVADLYKKNQLKFEMSDLLASLFKIGIILSILGFCLYPLILKLIVKDDTVLNLSSEALFWLNLAIIPEFFGYCMSICLNATQRGRYVLIYSCLEVIINIVLNYIFAKYFNLGFKGIYIATFIVSTITCILTFNQLISKYSLLMLKQFFKLSKNAFRLFPLVKISVEFIRVCVERASFLIMICIINILSKGDLIMTAFTIALGLYLLMLMPYMALMRTITIYSIQEPIEFQQHKNRITIGSICAGFLIIMIIFYQKSFIIKTIYNINDSNLISLTSDYISIILLILPLQALITVQRGMLYAQEKIKLLAVIDIFNNVFFIVPLFIIGQIFSNPILTWSGFFVAQLICLSYFGIFLHKQFLKEKTSRIFHMINEKSQSEL